MKLRVHDDGRWAVLAAPGQRLPWAVVTHEGEHLIAADEEWFGPGWHDAIVLPVDDTGARRLAEAIWGSERPSSPTVRSVRYEEARFYLDRLADGGERNAH
jgi:hypothetical protein